MGSIKRRRNQQKSKKSKEAGNKRTEEETSEQRKKSRVQTNEKGSNFMQQNGGSVVGGFLVLLLIAIIGAAAWWGNAGTTPLSPPPTQAPTTSAFTVMGSYELLETIPHDTSAFTQGLVAIQDSQGVLRLYEGTGMYGDSDLRILDLQGNVLDRHEIPSQYFGEGIVHFPVENNDNAYGLLQLTWRESTIFEYSISLTGLTVEPPFANETFASTKNEGWGITHDPASKIFYMTDGSAYVHVWDYDTRRELRKFLVKYRFPNHDAPIQLRYLNELEWDPATNTILANVLGQDLIVRIDPTSGFVSHMYQFDSIYPRSERRPGTDVFNGIALTYDLYQTEGNLDQEYWVTGKYWPNMYRVRLVDGQ